MKNETETMIEEFRAVAGTDGKYEISNLGRVRSNVGKSKIRKTTVSQRGYQIIILRIGGKSVTTSIHRLMADAFLWKPKGSKKNQVNHINGIKLDNRLENLEWSTASENMQHARDTGLNTSIGETSPQAKLTEAEVRDIRLLTESMTTTQLAKVYNVCKSTISSIVNRKSWKHI